MTPNRTHEIAGIVLATRELPLECPTSIGATSDSVGEKKYMPPLVGHKMFAISTGATLVLGTIDQTRSLT